MRTVRVILVDDHAIVIEALERALAVCKEIEVVGRARSLQELRVILQQQTPDIIILDLRLPDSKGADTIISTKAMCATAKIVIFTGSADVTEQIARRCGADAFVDKQTASDHLTRTVLNLAAIDSAAMPPESPLSVRELEVARLVSEGLTNAQIAKALFVSENTVKTHLSHILGKLRVNRRVDLARLWSARRESPGENTPQNHPNG